VDNGEEEEEPAANLAAPTSTSHTLVLSETRHAAEETSPSPQHLETSRPAASPRAPSLKRARVELGKEQGLLAGSSTTPSLDEISILVTILSFCRVFSLLNLSCKLWLAYDEGILPAWYSIHWVPRHY
jgi:hypothetical protein